MSSTPIEQLKREALAMSFDDSLHGFNRNLAALDAALANALTAMAEAKAAEADAPQLIDAVRKEG